MKNYISVWVLIIVSSLLFSCQKELSKINEDPNEAENPQPDYLLTSVIKSGADNYWGGTANYSGSQLIIQQWALIQYTDLDRYVFPNTNFSSFWSTIYSNNITDLDKIIELGRAQNNPNYVGIAHILRAWDFQLLTDAFGDIPYSQADNISKYPTPAYDRQQDVYHGILNELDSALNVLSDGSAVSGDAIYGGSISSWKKFANSLKLRIALRISDREPDLSKTIVGQVLASPAGLISSNAENAKVTYEDSPNWNPVAAIFSTREDSRISKTVVDRLYALNDPRLSVYADLPEDTSVHRYTGVPNGLATGDAAALGLTRTSRPGAYFRAAHAPAVILTYAEVLFLRSEAAARGLSSENAEDLYNKAIIASLNQYGITNETVISTYLAQNQVKYNTSNYKQSIGDQKWIALFGQGLEAFAEWRRLDYPQLQPAAAGVLNGKIPVRFIYPGTEQTLNSKSYQDAVNAQGPDNLLTHVWFDRY